MLASTSKGFFARVAFLVLRIGLAGCFIGHGAFGIITKAAWLPYFAVGGIAAPLGWKLMPWIGTMDILMGLLALLWPCRALLMWACVWTLWTASCRPLAGESIWEFVERAGNYGVPLALFAGIGWTGAIISRLTPDDFKEAKFNLVTCILRITTAAVMIGHAGCILAAPGHASFVHNYSAIWPDTRVNIAPEWAYIEALLGLGVLVRPSVPLLLVICVAKIGTESLFLVAHAPFWEVVERFGSYAAPLAFACLLLHREAFIERDSPTDPLLAN